MICTSSFLREFFSWHGNCDLHLHFCSGRNYPYCCLCIFSGIKKTVKFQKDLDKEMKNLTDLRNDFQQRLTTTVSSAEKDGKAPTIEEWLREAEELERKVLLTQQSIVANKKKKKRLCSTKRCRDSTQVSRLLREVQILLIKGRTFPQAQTIKHQG